MKEERFEDFTTVISGIHRDIQKIKMKFTRQLGLKSVHMYWLYLLRVHPEGLSASELAELGKTNKALVSREIDELVDKGFIVTSEHTMRRRYGWKFQLTDAGKQMAETIAEVALKVQTLASGEIPEEDMITFYRVINILLNNFDNMAENLNFSEMEIKI